jgi:menaquinone-specific isochorismate synthase
VSAPAPSAPLATLVARTRQLDHDVDLLAVAGEDGVVFSRERHGLAGQGVAAWLEVPAGDPSAAAAAVAEALGAVAADDEVGLPGTGPVALGALPFDPRRSGWLAVPRVLVGRAPDGSRWVTTVGSPDAEPPPLSAGAVAVAEPTGFQIRAERPPGEWCETVRSVRDDLRTAGTLRKVVLAREVVVEADQPLSVAAVLERLRHAYPSCMLFRTAGEHPLVGASPELLVARTGDHVRAHPLAGTAPRSGDPSTDARLAAELIASTKDQEEHRVTIDMVHDTLLPFCSYLDEEAEPSVVAMANVQHLGTLVEGRLARPPAHVIELVRALHPTPAVCGVPREAALAVIERVEGIDRGCYAGPVGWVDAAGNGEWAVGIRCAEVTGARARLFAGVGVLAGSDPQAELAETRAKLQALLSVLVQP